MKEISGASAGRRIIRNTGILTIGQTVTLGAGWLWTIIVARYVGPETYGFYAYIHSTLAVLVIFVNLGFDKLLTRDIAQRFEEGWSYLVTFSLIKIALSVLVLGGFLVFSLAGGVSGEQAGIILILTLMWFVDNLFVLATSFLYAREAMHYAVIGQVLNGLLTIATGALAVWLHQPFTVVLWLSLGASVLQLIVGYWYSVRLRGEVVRGFRTALLSLGRIRKLLVASIPFAALIMMAAVNANVMVLLLHLMTSDNTRVGYLSAALRVYSVAIIVPSMMSRAAFPTMSSVYANSPERFAAFFERGYRYIMLCTVPLGLGLCVVAPEFVKMIYGPAYAPAAPLLQILAIALVTGVGYASAPALEAMRRQGTSAVIFTGIVLCNAVVGYIAIPGMGALGVAWAVVASSVLGFVVYAVVLFPLLRLRYPIAFVLKTVIASLTMGAVSIWALTQMHFLFVVFAVAPATYTGVHLVLGTLSAEDWGFLRRLLPVPVGLRRDRATVHRDRGPGNPQL